MAQAHFYQILLVLVLCYSEVRGHGRLTVPSPRAKYLNIPDYLENAPVSLSSTAFVCRDQPRLDPQVTLTAGGETDFAWSFTALHPGDCFAYLSYDSDDSIPDNQKRFFKIAQWAECKNATDVDHKLAIPSYLPPCEKCILRFEWYALHNRPNIEYYAQCVDVSISGNVNGGLPSPMVYPGNTSLPIDGNQYRDAYNPTGFWFTGPPIATYTPGVTSTVTVTPVTTTPVTTTPVPTTTRPATTQPSTTKPATTKPATTQPATTQPVTTRPSTTKPATTQPVTTQPVTTKPMSNEACVFGTQRCATSETFDTCLQNGFGVTFWTATQNCARGTVCRNNGNGYISCAYA